MTVPAKSGLPTDLSERQGKSAPRQPDNHCRQKQHFTEEESDTRPDESIRGNQREIKSYPRAKSPRRWLQSTKRCFSRAVSRKGKGLETKKGRNATPIHRMAPRASRYFGPKQQIDHRPGKARVQDRHGKAGG